MKICLRYLSPKSPLSERELAIATLKYPLQFSNSLNFFFFFEDVHNMKICLRHIIITNIDIFGSLHNI